jgi:hypothetical protein
MRFDGNPDGIIAWVQEVFSVPQIRDPFIYKELKHYLFGCVFPIINILTDFQVSGHKGFVPAIKSLMALGPLYP